MTTTSVTPAARSLTAWIEGAREALPFTEGLVTNRRAMQQTLYAGTITRVANHFSELIASGDQPHENEDQLLGMIGETIDAAMLMVKNFDPEATRLAADMTILPELPNLGEGRWNALAEEILGDMITVQPDVATLRLALHLLP